MEGKPKIAVVAGELTHPRSLALFESLQSEFTVQVFALDTPHLVDAHKTSLKLRLFEVIDDMPGYLRGLEEELMSYDLIIGIDNSRLASFQGVRAARRFQIPYLAVINEFHPYFYETYANIRAIQFDINNKATAFLATSKLAAESLILDHVPDESIKVVRPQVNASLFQFDATKREKFRQYIGIKPNDQVILFSGELLASQRIEEILHALKLIRVNKLVDLTHVKLLIAGQGPFARELKYRAYDTGLGEQVMFLQQNADPFVVDLYSACDVIVKPQPRRNEIHEPFALELLEAAACGVYPIIARGTPEAESLGCAGTVIDDDTFQSIAIHLTKILKQGFSEEQRAEISQRFYKFQDDAQPAHALIRSVHQVLEQAKQERAGSFDSSAFESQVKSLVRARRERDAVVAIEECFVAEELNPFQKCELHCLKGEALYAAGELEEAMQAFGDSLRIDDKQYRSFRGLGYVAWQGHSNEEALTFFRKALAIKEDDPETILGIALVYRRLGLTEEALFWLEKCISLSMPPKSAFLALTQICLEISDRQAAIEIIERVIENSGESSSLLVTLAQLHMREGRAEMGNEILQKAMGL